MSRFDIASSAMRTPFRTRLLALAGFLLGVAVAAAGDWPGSIGPSDCAEPNPPPAGRTAARSVHDPEPGHDLQATTWSPRASPVNTRPDAAWPRAENTRRLAPAPRSDRTVWAW